MAPLSITLQNFRNFPQLALSINKTRVVIEGANGVGKSSIIEALHYLCYLRSFRGAQSRDIALQKGDGSFFIKIEGTHNDEPYSVQVGYANGVKRVKINDQIAGTYKEIMDRYRVVTIAEHDVALVQEGPEHRRSFLNQFCILQDALVAELLREHKHIVMQRTLLIAKNDNLLSDYHKIWTDRLWQATEKLTAIRQQALQLLTKKLQWLLEQLGEAFVIELRLICKNRKNEQSFDLFWQQYQQSIVKSESKTRRTQFGAHLDDVEILLNGAPARIFASRGQQKLIMLLLKLAQILILEEQHHPGLLFLLLDDVMTDFDARILTKLLMLIDQMNCVVIATCPLSQMVTFGPKTEIISLSSMEAKG